MPKMRAFYYAGVSTLLAASVVLRAFLERPNFYSATVYLAQSNACLMILTNMALLCVCGVMYGLQLLLIGRLRPIEVEQLYEKGWLAVTETLLAMTVFRDEVGVWFLIMFVSLLIGRVWGWIGEGRVEYLEQQPPANPRLFHTRLASSLTISVLFDLALLKYCVDVVLDQARPGMMLMFAFEFAILSMSSLSSLARYLIVLREQYMIKQQTAARKEVILAERRAARQAALEQATAEAADGSNGTTEVAPLDEEIEEHEIDVPGWEEKGRWIFGLDLVTDFFKLIVYMAFFSILTLFHGIPIYIMRDVYFTLRSFHQKIRDYIMYRNATKDMNSRYPDATAEELSGDNTCIICREEMRPWQPPAQQAAGQAVDERQRPKKLPCGHILHFNCLRSWLERQQACPTCRRPVINTNQPQGNTENAPAGLGGNVNGALGQNAPGGAHPQGHGAPRPAGPGQAARERVFRLGPLQIAFGMGGPEQIRDMINRLNARAGQPQPRQQAQRTQPALTNVAHGSANIQAQLTQLEQAINREIQALNGSREQLTLVTLLLRELERLRRQQEGERGNNVNNIPPPSMLPPLGASTSAQPPRVSRMPSNYAANFPLDQVQYGLSVPVNSPFPHGPSLPVPGWPGVYLPPGWSVTPMPQGINGLPLGRSPFDELLRHQQSLFPHRHANPGVPPMFQPPPPQAGQPFAAFNHSPGPQTHTFTFRTTIPPHMMNIPQPGQQPANQTSTGPQPSPAPAPAVGTQALPSRPVSVPNLAASSSSREQQPTPNSSAPRQTEEERIAAVWSHYPRWSERELQEVRDRWRVMTPEQMAEAMRPFDTPAWREPIPSPDLSYIAPAANSTQEQQPMATTSVANSTATASTSTAQEQQRTPSSSTSNVATNATEPEPVSTCNIVQPASPSATRANPAVPDFLSSEPNWTFNASTSTAEPDSQAANGAAVEEGSISPVQESDVERAVQAQLRGLKRHLSEFDRLMQSVPSHIQQSDVERLVQVEPTVPHQEELAQLVHSVVERNLGDASEPSALSRTNAPGGERERLEPLKEDLDWEEEEQGAPSSSKGKGKAATVEEVEDVEG